MSLPRMDGLLAQDVERASFADGPFLLPQQYGETDASDNEENTQLSSLSNETNRSSSVAPSGL